MNQVLTALFALTLSTSALAVCSDIENSLESVSSETLLSCFEKEQSMQPLYTGEGSSNGFLGFGSCEVSASHARARAQNRCQVGAVQAGINPEKCREFLTYKNYERFMFQCNHNSIFYIDISE